MIFSCFLSWLPGFFLLQQILFQFSYASESSLNFFHFGETKELWNPSGGFRLFLSLRLGFVVPRDKFCPSGRLEIFFALRPGFFVLREKKILSFGVEIFLALRPSLRSVSVPKKFPPLRTKFFNSPSGQKSLASVRKKFPAAPQDKTYPLGQQSPTFGTKKACTSLGIPKFFGFPKMKKVQTTFRSIKN